MDRESGLEFTNQLMLAKTGEALNHLEIEIFKGSWDGLSYQEIATNTGDSKRVHYIEKDAGFKLWQKLSKALGVKVRKKNFKAQLQLAWKQQQQSASNQIWLPPLESVQIEDVEIVSTSALSIISQDNTSVLPTQLELTDKQKTEASLSARMAFIFVNLRLVFLLLLWLVGFRWLLPKLHVEFNDRGVDCHLENDFAIAWIYYQCALLIKPDYATAHYNLGSLLEKQRHFDKACTHYDIARNGGIIEAYNNLARLQITKKQYIVAANLLEQSLQLNPDEVVIKYSCLKNLAWAKFKQCRYDEAKVYLQEAIGLIGDRAVAYGLMAQLLEAQGDKHNAKLAWEKFVKYAPSDRSPEVEAWMLIAP